MNEKLTLQDLVDLLSQKAKITKKDSDSFFREFFQLILERIYDNDLVRIKDFGTFKLVSVNSRESINVNTGEKIEIPAHSKLSFVPDKVLKNLVNKPFSQFETILLDDDGVKIEVEIKDEEEAVVEDGLASNVLESNINETSVNPNEEVIVAKDKVKASQPKKIETPSASKSKEKILPKKEIYPTSFVYTYTTSTTESASNSITLSVDKEQLRNVVEKVQKEIVETTDDSTVEELISLIDSNNSQDISNAIEDSEVSKVDPDEAEVLEDAVLLDSNLLEDELLGVSLDEGVDLNIMESELNSQLEMESDIIIPIPIVDTISTREENSEKIKYSNEDPERPLFPEEDDLLQDDINDEWNELEKTTSAIETRHTGNNRPVETKSVSFANAIDTEDIVYPDYSNTSRRSKIKNWLPMVLFVLVIVGFLAYGVVKMLKEPQAFEYYLDRAALVADTSMAEDATQKISDTDAILDSMKRLQDSSKVDDTTRAVLVADSMITSSFVKENTTQSVVEEEMLDSLITDPINGDNMGIVFSDKLKFRLKNKAEYHLQKVKSSNLSKIDNHIDSSTSTSKKQYATIKRGTTLRTISANFYGNASFWGYIYQANKARISDPNNIPIGTQLVIPLLSDYGIVNPKDAKAIQTAKSLESKILRETN